MEAVAKPKYVYHGTRPPLVHKIAKEGLRSDSGFSNFGGQGGVSVTTNLKVARQFGSAVIVLDPKKLKRAGYTLEPFQHSTAPNESELRVTGKTTPTMIPSSLFEKVISYWKPLKYEVKWWEDNLPKLKLEVASLTRDEAIALTNAAMQTVAGLELPFKVGDTILFGKYKNKKGKIISFGTNHKGQPTVTIEPIPKGRKKNKELGLFKIWTMPKAEATAASIPSPPQSRFWHITEHKDFKIDPKNGGFLAWGTGKQTTNLFVANEDGLATWSLHPYLKGRKYAAEIDVSRVGNIRENKVSTEVPGEFVIKDPKNAKVIRVVPLSRALKDADALKSEKSKWLKEHTDLKRGAGGGWKLVLKDGSPYRPKEWSTLPKNVRSAKDPYAAFMAEYKAGTVPNFVERRSRIFNDEVWLEVAPWEADKSIHLGFMMVLDKPREGHGGRALKWLTGLADKHGVDMSLSVEPRGKFKMPKAKLKALYKKFGFVSTHGDSMRRKSKSKKKIKATLVATTNTDFPECDEMPPAPVMPPWKDDAQLGTDPDHHAEFPPYDEDPPPGQPVDVVYSKRTASRSTVYHGTSNAVLKSILSKGLVPGKSKTWESDTGTGILTPSRVSYGGVYFAENFMTAVTSARKAQEVLGGDAPVLIEAIVQPKTALPDEDDFHGAVVRGLSAAWRRVVDHEWTIMLGFMAMSQGEDRNARKGFAEAFRKWLEDKGAWPEKHDKPGALRSLLDDMYEAAVTRMASHVRSQDWDRILREDPDLKQPKTHDGERMYREALDAITKAFRRVAIPSENAFAHTLRMMEPVAYSGRNRITAVVELVDYNRRDYDKPAQIKVHKGNPARLLKEYEKAIGHDYELV